MYFVCGESFYFLVFILKLICLLAFLTTYQILAKAQKRLPEEYPTTSPNSPRSCMRDTLANLLTAIIASPNSNNLNEFSCNTNNSAGGD